MSSGTVVATTTGNVTAVQKRPEENYTTITIFPTAGAVAYTTTTFTVEASVDGTNYEQVAVVDLKTGLLVAGGTSIAPTNGTTRSFAFPNAQNYTRVRVNVGAIASGSASFTVISAAIEGTPLFTSVAGAAGSFTNVVASGTLAVTGASTLSGGATISGVRAAQTTAVATTGATTVLLADSGGIFNIDQDAAFDIDLPSPTSGAGCVYTFVVGDAGANDVTITVAGAAATFIGTIQIDGATTTATGSTLTFVSGSASVGDTIVVKSISTTLYHVQAIAIAAGGITAA
jgi:hypothetical protein